MASFFGKRHDDVLKTVRNIIPELPQDRLRDFAETVCTRPNPSGGVPIKSPAYHLTRDGFTLLAMGFTGKKALHFKIAYIAAFNAMEAELLRRADDGGRRRIDISHRHFRSTAAPLGLDIRYTLDLTKIIRSPSSKTLKLLSRLTGVDMDDLVEMGAEAVTPVAEGLVETFLAECCLAIPAESTPFAKVYAAFVEWFSWQGAGPHDLLARRRFSDFVASRGYGRVIRGGQARVLGLALRAAVEVQS